MMRWLVPQRSRSHSEVKGQNEYCLIGLPCQVHISTMHHRILKLLGTHVHHDEVACTSKVKVMVKGINEYCLIGLPIGRSVGSHILSQGAVLGVFIIFSDSSS